MYLFRFPRGNGGLVNIHTGAVVARIPTGVSLLLVSSVLYWVGQRLCRTRSFAGWVFRTEREYAADVATPRS